MSQDEEKDDKTNMDHMDKVLKKKCMLANNDDDHDETLNKKS